VRRDARHADKMMRARVQKICARYTRRRCCALCYDDVEAMRIDDDDVRHYVITDVLMSFHYHHTVTIRLFYHDADYDVELSPDADYYATRCLLSVVVDVAADDAAADVMRAMRDVVDILLRFVYSAVIARHVEFTVDDMFDIICAARDVICRRCCLFAFMLMVDPRY